MFASAIYAASLHISRAIAIGLFAPFPKMWLAKGSQVGLKGRLLSGLETMSMYWIELAAVIGIWRGRKNLTMWLLLIVACAGMTALGLVVVNLATLYRMRYVLDASDYRRRGRRQ
jgi:hypothetical protein